MSTLSIHPSQGLQDNHIQLSVCSCCTTCAPFFAGLCEDVHPQCHEWSQKGECERNPGFMVGWMSTQHQGFQNFQQLAAMMISLCLLPYLHLFWS